MTCEYCSRLTTSETEHAPSPTALVASADICWLCFQIEQRLYPNGVPDAVSNSLIETSSEDWPLKCKIIILEQSVKLKISNLPNVYVKLGACFTNEDDPAASQGIPIRKRLTCTASDASFATAKRWLADCQLKHNCSDFSAFVSRGNESESAPARILDVYAFPSTSDDVRLVRWKKPVEYVALSYSWGKGEFFVTSESSLHSRMERILYSDLPRTVQDAVTITRKLGYRYLWVDALCIIQDSTKDWESESQKMGILYSQAVVTISATSSTSVYDGCFNQQSLGLLSDSYQTIIARQPTRDGSVSELFICKKQLNLGSATPIEIAPLDKRAWTCQERILSTRILHYTKEQLFWECRSNIENEEGISGYYQHLRGSVTAPGIVRQLASLSVEADPSHLILEWYNLIINSLYSDRLLTRWSDRLPAISGLARFIQGRTNITYLAGLWKEQLHYGLYWGVHRYPTRCEVNTSPTWSWTSVNSRVWWPMLKIQEPAQLTLRDYNIVLAGDDPFGCVTSATLEITGFVRECSIVRSTVSETINLCEIEPIDTVSFSGIRLDRPPEIDSLHALILAKRGKDSYWWVLLLTPVSGQPNTFERAGIAIIEDAELSDVSDCPRCFERRDITLV